MRLRKTIALKNCAIVTHIQKIEDANRLSEGMNCSFAASPIEKGAQLPQMRVHPRLKNIRINIFCLKTYIYISADFYQQDTYKT